MKNFLPPRLFAVIIEHAPIDCPLNQESPHDAYILADNLERTKTHGVFSMKQHFGIDLVKTDSPKQLTQQYVAILPKHKPVFIIDVNEDEGLQRIYGRADKLDTDEQLRLSLFEYMSAHVNFIDSNRTVEEKLPTRSLKTLPEYLRANAPASVTQFHL
jgi:hypothetical protein